MNVFLGGKSDCIRRRKMLTVPDLINIQYIPEITDISLIFMEDLYGNVLMDGTHFVEGIKNNTIDLLTLENMNKTAFTDYIDRIRSFVCIDTILKKCEYLWSLTGIIGDSKIKVKYHTYKKIVLIFKNTFGNGGDGNNKIYRKSRRSYMCG